MFNLSAAAVLPAGPLAESKTNEIGYKTVADALSALTTRTDVTVTTVREWNIITDETNKIVWSFAPSSYPGYPAAVQREVDAKTDGTSEILMLVLTRHGYSIKNLVEQFDSKAVEIKALFNNTLDATRTGALRKKMLRAGLPI